MRAVGVSKPRGQPQSGGEGLQHAAHGGGGGGGAHLLMGWMTLTAGDGTRSSPDSSTAAPPACCEEPLCSTWALTTARWVGRAVRSLRLTDLAAPMH